MIARRSTKKGAAPHAGGAGTVQNSLQHEYTPDTAVLTLGGLRALRPEIVGNAVGVDTELLGLCVAADFLGIHPDEMFERPPVPRIRINGACYFRLIDIRRLMSGAGLSDAACRDKLGLAFDYHDRCWAVTEAVFDGVHAPSRVRKGGLRAHELAATFNGGNRRDVAVLLGKPSGNLVVLHLATPSAVAIGRVTAHPTGCVFEPHGGDECFLLYVAGGYTPRSRQYVDPETGLICQVLGRETKLRFPPSAASGSDLEWKAFGKPRASWASQIVTDAAIIAANALLADRWPKERQAQWMAAEAIVQAFLDASYTWEDSRRIAAAIARTAGDGQMVDAIESGLVPTIRPNEDPAGDSDPLGRVFGTAVADRFREWRHIRRPSRRDGGRP